jgi:hydrogenase maturation protease
MLTIIGCGNPNRGDDGVGIEVARRLEAHVRATGAAARVFDAGTDGMGVMFRARGASRLVIVDASRSGAAPGTIYRVPGAELERQYEPALNLHDFRWDHALYAGRRIFGADFPADVAVVLVEAASVEPGVTLSAPVAAAAGRVVEMIAALIDPA